MSEAILDVDSVVAGYKKPVVGPVSFQLADGEIVGLAGPNGAGKSTILGAIIGKSRIFSGSVRRRAGIRVGIQGQAPVRLTEMPITGRDFLGITGAHRQEVPAPLKPLLPKRLDFLSGGHYQLMNVWACLGCHAELVLLDEPTNNMDPRSTASLVEVLRISRESGRGVLVVSHEHDFLEQVCTRLVEVQP